MTAFSSQWKPKSVEIPVSEPIDHENVIMTWRQIDKLLGARLERAEAAMRANPWSAGKLIGPPRPDYLKPDAPWAGEQDWEDWILDDLDLDEEVTLTLAQLLDIVDAARQEGEDEYGD